MALASQKNMVTALMHKLFERVKISSPHLLPTHVQHSCPLFSPTPPSSILKLQPIIRVDYNSQHIERLNPI